MTFKLVQAKDQTCLPCEFGPNPFSGYVDISYTNKKVTDSAKNRTLRSSLCVVITTIHGFSSRTIRVSHIRIKTNRHQTTTTTLHPFNGLFSRKNWVSRHQKGKPFWILLQREDEVAVTSAGPYANHLHLAPDRQLCQYLTAQFLQAGCPSCHPINSVKALKA